MSDNQTKEATPAESDASVAPKTPPTKETTSNTSTSPKQSPKAAAAAASSEEKKDLEPINTAEANKDIEETSSGLSTPDSIPQAPFTPTFKSARTGLHYKLKAYEARRRLANASKYESSSLYWKSFRDLLAASVQETARAQRLVIGTARAHQLYADAMKAMHDDLFLDEKGSVLLNKAKQQKKVAATRPKLKKKPDGRDSVLTSIRETQQLVGERFEENSKNMDTEIAEELGVILENLKTKVAWMERLGNQILLELEKTEQEVVQAWSVYYSKAITLLDADAPEFSPTTSALNSPQESAPNSNNDAADVWLVEMQYRVSVAYQNVAWEKGSAELAKLFATLKKEECTRRINLREYLVAFVQRQQRLFSSLQDVHNPVLNELVGRKITLEETEQMVQNVIRERAQHLQREADKESKNNILAAYFKDTSPDDGDFVLESPLTSELLYKAKVIERKNPGVMQSWKTTLAIVTLDSFLHFFDLPSQDRVQPGSAAEVAFQALVPKVVVPNAENINNGKSNFAKGWSDSLIPTESYILAKCSIHPKDELSLELVETVAATGASKMFGKTATRKVLLRAITNGELMDWIDALKASPL